MILTKVLSKQYKVSCDELGFLVEQAKLNGHILGTRMMGGGFGAVLFLIEKTETESFKTFISEAYKNKFNQDCSIYSVKLSNRTHLFK